MKKYTFSEFAQRTGLSQASIRRDEAMGTLKCRRFRGAILTTDGAITDWLIERNLRCNGLTFESKKWLAALVETC